MLTTGFPIVERARRAEQRHGAQSMEVGSRASWRAAASFASSIRERDDAAYPLPASGCSAAVRRVRARIMYSRVISTTASTAPSTLK